MENTTHIMPCGYTLKGLVQDLVHFSICSDYACKRKSDEWAATIKRHAKTQPKLKQVHDLILDKTKKSCSSVVGKPNPIRQAPRQVVNKGASQTMKTKKQKAAGKAQRKPKAAKAKKQAVTNTGYVAMITSLLLKQQDSVDDAAKKVLKKFPEKNIKSLKRIAYNVAKRLRRKPETSNIHWLPSSRQDTGYMARINELLFTARQNNRTTRLCAEVAAKEFDKDVISVKKVLRARFKRLRDSGQFKGKQLPLLESELKQLAGKAEKKNAKNAKPSKIAKAIAKSEKKARAKAVKKARTPRKPKAAPQPVEAAAPTPAETVASA